MSWGERSCKPPCRSEKHCNSLECTVNCPGYIWDGTTKPDTSKIIEPEPKPVCYKCGKPAFKSSDDGKGWLCKGCYNSEFFPTYRRENKKIGRNTLCTCGSGKKYKRCCYGKA